MRRMSACLISVLLASACSGRQTDGGESDLDPGEQAEQPGEPSWSSCVVRDEYETCTQVCEAEGTTCAAEACPADPMYCKPNDCDMATSLLGLGDGICSDPTVGGYVAASCDDPIEFVFTDTARCCCES